MTVLAHRICGSGQHRVVLLHGFLGSGRNLAALANRWAQLQPQWQFIMPDLPGHGDSSALAPGAEVFAMAREVLRFATRLHLPRPLRFVGHSMGGRVALAARLLDPRGVSAIALLDISPGPLPALMTGTDSPSAVLELLLAAPAQAHARSEMRQFFIDGGLSTLLIDWLLMNLVRDGKHLRWRINREALAKFHSALVQADLWPAVELAPHDTLCIRGGASAFVREADVQRFKALGSSVETLAGAGHFVHVDAQQQLLSVLMHWQGF